VNISEAEWLLEPSREAEEVPLSRVERDGKAVVDATGEGDSDVVIETVGDSVDVLKEVTDDHADADVHPETDAVCDSTNDEDIDTEGLRESSGDLVPLAETDGERELRPVFELVPEGLDEVDKRAEGDISGDADPERVGDRVGSGEPELEGEEVDEDVDVSVTVDVVDGGGDLVAVEVREEPEEGDDFGEEDEDCEPVELGLVTRDTV